MVNVFPEGVMVTFAPAAMFTSPVKALRLVTPVALEKVQVVVVQDTPGPLKRNVPAEPLMLKTPFGGVPPENRQLLPEQLTPLPEKLKAPEVPLMLVTAAGAPANVQVVDVQLTPPPWKMNGPVMELMLCTPVVPPPPI